MGHSMYFKSAWVKKANALEFTIKQNRFSRQFGLSYDPVFLSNLHSYTVINFSTIKIIKTFKQ